MIQWHMTLAYIWYLTTTPTQRSQQSPCAPRVMPESSRSVVLVSVAICTYCMYIRISHFIMIDMILNKRSRRDCFKKTFLFKNSFLDCSIEVNDFLQVSQNCDHIYLDGSEIRGSKNASILVTLMKQESRQYTTSVYVQIWIPEHRLDIQLSDSKLSQVRGWKILKKMEPE